MIKLICSIGLVTGQALCQRSENYVAFFPDPKRFAFLKDYDVLVELPNKDVGNFGGLKHAVNISGKIILGLKLIKLDLSTEKFSKSFRVVSQDDSSSSETFSRFGYCTKRCILQRVKYIQNKHSINFEIYAPIASEVTFVFAPI